MEILLVLIVAVAITGSVAVVCLCLVKMSSAITTMLVTSLQAVTSPGARTVTVSEEPPEVEHFKTPGWEEWNPPTWTDEPFDPEQAKVLE